MYQGKFKVGDLVLDYSDRERKWKWKPIVPVIRIERVSPKFYTFSCGWRPWRKKAETIDPHLVLVPPRIPWGFPKTFSDFCELGTVSYRTRQWKVMEVGYQFPSRFEQVKDDFTNQIYRFPKDYSFQLCGYGLQEGTGDAAIWFWAESLTDIVRHLKARAAHVENEVAPVGDGLPEELVERGMVAWNGPAIQAGKRELKPGDFFAYQPIIAPGVMIGAFERILEPGEIVTTRGHVARLDALYEPPTAFPPAVLERVQLIAEAFSFAEVRMWAAFTDTMPVQESVLYYTNDGIRWYRKLSAALQLEIGRLVLTRSGGLPRIN
jgi:hypothetical protein